MHDFDKLLFILSIIFIFDISTQAQNRFVISGTIPKEYNGVDVKLSFEDSNHAVLSTKVENGAFHFSREMSQEYEHVFLNIFKADERLGSWNFFVKSESMRLEIGSLNANDDQPEIRYFNVPFIEEQQRYIDLTKPVHDSLICVLKLIRKTNNGIISNRKKDSLTVISKGLQNEQLTRKIEFIKTILGSYFGLYIFNKEIVPGIYSMFISPDSLIALYSLFDRSLTGTELGKKIHSYLYKKKGLSINSTLPDFSFRTNDGNGYKLSFFRSKKYVLLCFWDSWCKPCIESMPTLKEIYEEYANKGLQIISVSIDNNTEKWFSSLNKYSLPWLNTCDLPDFIHGQSVKALYDIQYMPQYFLINKEGALIYHNVFSNDDSLYSILRQILRQSLN